MRIRYLARQNMRSSPPTPDHQHRRVHVRRRHEGTPRQTKPDGTAESRRSAGGIPPCHSPLQHDVCCVQLAAARQQPPQQLGGDPVRRVSHHPERPPRQRHAKRVTLHHGNARAPRAEHARPSRIQLDRHHSRPSGNQVRRQSPMPRADVEHKLARPYPGRGDHPRRPFVSEPVPAPLAARSPGGGHGRPSPCRYPPADRSPPPATGTTGYQRLPGQLVTRSQRRQLQAR